MSRYTLSLSSRQLDVVTAALELYYRVHMGQWSEVLHVCYSSPRRPDRDIETPRKLVNMASELWTGLPASARFGIANDAIDDTARIACDVSRVIKHHRWKERPREKRDEWSVSSHEHSPLSDEPKPTVVPEK